MNNLAEPRILHLAFVAKCEKQIVVKLLTCNFSCQKDFDSIVFLVIRGLMCNLDSLSQEFRLFKVDRPKTGRVRAKHVLQDNVTGACPLVICRHKDRKYSSILAY